MLTILTGMFLASLLQAADPNAAPESADAAAASQDQSPGAADPAATSTQAVKITDKNHPDYVRCRSEPMIGSLAKRKKTCMTNREWEAIARAGNRGARDIVESQQVGMNGQ